MAALLASPGAWAMVTSSVRVDSASRSPAVAALQNPVTYCRCAARAVLDAGLGFLGEQPVPVQLRQCGGDRVGFVVVVCREVPGLVGTSTLQPARGQFTGSVKGGGLPPDPAVLQQPAVLVAGWYFLWLHSGMLSPPAVGAPPLPTHHLTWPRRLAGGNARRPLGVGEGGSQAGNGVGILLPPPAEPLPWPGTLRSSSAARMALMSADVSGRRTSVRAG